MIAMLMMQHAQEELQHALVIAMQGRRSRQLADGRGKSG
jgi:hypothetical protein